MTQCSEFKQGAAEKKSKSRQLSEDFLVWRDFTLVNILVRQFVRYLWI